MKASLIATIPTAHMYEQFKSRISNVDNAWWLKDYNKDRGAQMVQKNGTRAWHNPTDDQIGVRPVFILDFSCAGDQIVEFHGDDEKIYFEKASLPSFTILQISGSRMSLIADDIIGHYQYDSEGCSFENSELRNYITILMDIKRVTKSKINA